MSDRDDLRRGPIDSMREDPRERQRVPRPLLEALVEAVQSVAPVSLGRRRTKSPHEFYRYPARFTPDFARSAIEAFSKPGDVVLDPFVGGGTTAVEAVLAGRRALVADLNPLATFVTRAKTTPLNPAQLHLVERWIADVLRHLRLGQPASAADDWRREGYLRQLESRSTWRISKLIRIALRSLPTTDIEVERFCRCIVLRTAQWAFDMRSSLPSVQEFRQVLIEHGNAMVAAATVFAGELRKADEVPIVIDAALPGLSSHPHVQKIGMPQVIITSPPYPGVYINYHRWKLLGRKEIPAPYWIVGCRDGHGLAHYTMSARAEPTLGRYFDRLHAAYEDLARISSAETILVQMVGFSDTRRDLPRFLHAMASAGFAEFQLPELSTGEDGRLWRSVPGRRWWAEAHSRRSIVSQTAKEVVLLHRASGT